VNVERSEKPGSGSFPHFGVDGSNGGSPYDGWPGWKRTVNSKRITKGFEKEWKDGKGRKQRK